jgi:anhydro-N-acetylmuramic acid kinase
MINQLNHVLQKKKRVAVGLMSGTSLDGIDAALVEIEYSSINTRVRLVEFETFEYTEEEKKRILGLCHPDSSTVKEICEMNVMLGQKFAEATKRVIRKAGFTSKNIDFISSHGQTIYHMPEKQATLQIGELAVIAEETGCITVGDFRPSDMAAGGQGAPLVPFVDYLLFRSQDQGRALINIGGISNVTVLKAGAAPEDVIAFDTGPGNLLIDGIVRIGTSGRLAYDVEGQIAAQGNVCQELLKELVDKDAYINLPPPKSTGRERYTTSFLAELWSQGVARAISFEDIVATVTAYTAHSIAINFKENIEPHYKISEVLVAGGGVHNRTLMNLLTQLLKQNVSTMDDLNFSSDAKEAIAFAILGNEFLNGNSNNLPSATGAERPIVMGKLVFPSRGL